MQNDRQHHDAKGDRKPCCELPVGLRTLLDLAPDRVVIAAGQVERLQAGANGLQELPGRQRGAPGSDGDRSFLVFPPDASKIELRP